MEHSTPARSALQQRVLTGLALAVPALVIVVYGGRFLTLLSVALYFAACYEFYSVVCRSLPKLRNPLFLLSAFAPLGFFIGSMYGSEWRGFIIGYSLSVLLACMITVLLHRERRPRVETLFPAFSGLLIPTLLGSSLYMVSDLAGRTNLVLWLILGVVASDTFAFFGGRALQGPKLAPELSPNKTVSGAVVGFISSIGVMCLAGNFLNLPIEQVQIVAAAVAISVLAQFGDLSEVW